MPKPPILLFLHGVGTGDPEDKWRNALDLSLTRIGYPDLSGVTVVAPKYPFGLRGVDDDEPLPKVTVKTLRGDRAKAHRREFQRRRTAMEVRLGSDDQGDGWPLAPRAAPFAARLLQQANNYTKQRKIRAWVLDRALKKLPSSGQVVIVGHSLGSVIAADLLRRLPPDLEVVGMVTIGSPLAHEALRVGPVRDLLAEPPANLAWWVNFRSTGDPVPTGRGLSTVFPWVLDQRISESNPIRAHFAATYLNNDSVAAAVGFGLFGSQSTELVVVDKGLEIPLDDVERIGLLALRYAHLTLDKLEGDTHDRYADALRDTQSNFVEQVKARNESIGRPTPSAIAELVVDVSDPASEVSKPRLPDHLDVEDAVVPLLALAEANIVRPYEISVSKKDQQGALQKLTVEMELGEIVGENVFEALDTARKVVKGPVSKLKWAAIGLGSAAVVAATGGLALAAAPGLAGAAAVTSALAAFGPGGMIGGLLTAGTLMSAGGGSLAVGLAAPGTTAETVEAVVTAQLAAAVFRERQGLAQDPQIWMSLVELEIEATRELARFEVVSDESAPSVKELKRKLITIDLALDYLHEHGLKPGEVEVVADRRQRQPGSPDSKPRSSRASVHKLS